MKMKRLVTIAVITAGISSSAQGATYYVRESGIGDGSSWSNASGDLQSMIELCASSSGGEVWVAEGTYIPIGWPNGTDENSVTESEKEVHFSLRNGVSVLGGFPSTNDAVTLADRDPRQFETVLSGDIGVQDERSDDSFHVFYHPSSAALDETAILDGVVITKGRAGPTISSAPWHNQGGGMRNESCSPTLFNCVVRSNFAKYEGAAIYNKGCHPLLVGCDIRNNYASQAGGLYNNNSSPIVSNCVFTANTAKYNGGAVYESDAAQASYDRCIFFMNRCVEPSGKGNTVNNVTSSSVFNNCLFVDQVAYGWKDCVYSYCAVNHSEHPVFSGCTFFGMAGNTGYGIRNTSGIVELRNCVVSGFATSISSTYSLVTHSLIQGGHSGTGNIDANPNFINSENAIGYDGLWGTFDDGFSLNYGSPAIGSGSVEFGLSGIDLVGNPRVHGGSIEMGAYSFFPDPDGDGMADAWEQQIVAASSGTIANVEGVLAHADFDGDGRDNNNEFVAGTDPLDPSSRFNCSLNTATGEIHYFPCTEGRSYSYAWTTDLKSGSWTEMSISPVSDGSTGETILLPDTSPHNSEPIIFYNVDITL